MKAFSHVMQDDARFFIACHGKTDIIGTTVGRHVRAPVGIAHIAEIAQFEFGRSKLLKPGAAGSRKAGA